MSKATLTIRLNSSYVLIGTTSDRLGTGAARPPAPRVSILYCHGMGAQIWAARLLGRSNIELTTILLWVGLRGCRISRRPFLSGAVLYRSPFFPSEITMLRFYYSPFGLEFLRRVQFCIVRKTDEGKNSLVKGTERNLASVESWIGL